MFFPTFSFRHSFQLSFFTLFIWTVIDLESEGKFHHFSSACCPYQLSLSISPKAVVASGIIRQFRLKSLKIIITLLYWCCFEFWIFLTNILLVISFFKKLQAFINCIAFYSISQNDFFYFLTSFDIFLQINKYLLSR